MEFLDEESRPSRFLFQSRSSSSSTPKPETLKINKIQAAICIAISSLFFALAIFFFQSETLQFLFIWLAFSLIIGPFAPISIIGGDIRVGEGSTLEFPDPDPIELDEAKKRTVNRRPKSRRSDDPPSISPLPVPEALNSSKTEKISSNSACNGNESATLEESEWTDEDFDLLKKQISKHPAGEPRRWELITEAFRGKHGLESVRKTAKSMSEKKPGGNDSFAQFLKQRKLQSKQIEAVDPSVASMEGEDLKKESENGSSWSPGEDLALLNALKAFPKDVSMRWEKISAAVPGKSKGCCMKRVAELKRGFRSSKASES